MTGHLYGCLWSCRGVGIHSLGGSQDPPVIRCLEHFYSKVEHLYKEISWYGWESNTTSLDIWVHISLSPLLSPSPAGQMQWKTLRVISIKWHLYINMIILKFGVMQNSCCKLTVFSTGNHCLAEMLCWSLWMLRLALKLLLVSWHLVAWVQESRLSMKMH